MTRRPRERYLPRREAFVEKRRYPAPDEIAGQRLVGVRLVLDPLQAVLARVSEDSGAGNAQEWADKCLSLEPGFRKHSAGPTPSRPAQQVHENGLGLVIEVVGKRDAIGIGFRKSVVPRLARRRFQTFSVASDLDPAHGERNSPSLAQRAAERRPRIGVRAQAVVDVNRADRPFVL